MVEVPFAEQLPLEQLIAAANSTSIRPADFAYFQQLVEDADWKFTEFWNGVKVYANSHMEGRSEEYLLLSAQTVRKALGGTDGLLRKYANLIEWVESDEAFPKAAEITVLMLRHYLLLMQSAARGEYPPVANPKAILEWEKKFYDGRPLRRVAAFESLRQKLEQTFEGELSAEKGVMRYADAIASGDPTANSIDYTLTNLLGHDYERLAKLEQKIAAVENPTPKAILPETTKYTPATIPANVPVVLTPSTERFSSIETPLSVPSRTPHAVPAVHPQATTMKPEQGTPMWHGMITYDAKTGTVGGEIGMFVSMYLQNDAELHPEKYQQLGQEQQEGVQGDITTKLTQSIVGFCKAKGIAEVEATIYLTETKVRPVLRPIVPKSSNER